MQLHLVRHGQTDWNAARRIQGHRDIPLDHTGRAQARALGETLKQTAFSAVYSSTSCRARETAELVLQRSQAIICRDELREICLGEWEGRYWQEIERQEPDRYRQHMSYDPDFRAPGAETRGELRRRGIAALSAIVTETGTGNVLVVSHGALIKQVLAAFMNIDLSARNPVPPVPNCAHSIIDIVDGVYDVRFVDGQPAALWMRSG